MCGSEGTWGAVRGMLWREVRLQAGSYLLLTAEILERGDEIWSEGNKSASQRINTKDTFITGRIWQLIACRRMGEKKFRIILGFLTE